MQPTDTPALETALLVGVALPYTSKWAVDDALDELALLADTAGARIAARITQSLPRPNVATYIGKGKVSELKALVGQHNADLVIFDDDLSTVQLRNLEKALKCKLMDRSGLILDIFARRAKTATAKTQVELAQLEYMLTRLTRQWTHLSRQKGGIGTKGPGETQIETDRRLIRRRIAVLKKRLRQIDQQRTTQRKRRSNMSRAALVGYTNAGKSTLMNLLAAAKVLAEDRLFATLDATTRVVQLDTNKPILLTDTVGFIRKLPHRLIESFKSTLDEVRESDVLIHVVDVSHPCCEDHIRVVNHTLTELGTQDKPFLMVFNKVDTVKEKGTLQALREQYPDAVFISALRGIGLDTFRKSLLAATESDLVERIAYVPAQAGQAVAYIHRQTEVLNEEYMLGQTTPDGPADVPMVRLRFRVSRKHDKDLAQMLSRYADLRPAPSSHHNADIVALPGSESAA